MTELLPPDALPEAALIEPFVIGPISAEALAALASAMDFAGEALAPATLRAYRGAWLHFCAWCDAAGWPALPAAPERMARIRARATGSVVGSHASAAAVSSASFSRAESGGFMSKVRSVRHGLDRRRQRAVGAIQHGPVDALVAGPDRLDRGLTE